MSVQIYGQNQLRLSTNIQDIMTYESISFLIFSLASYGIWLPIFKDQITKGYGLIPGVIIFYHTVLLEQWWEFISSDGNESYFITLYSICKWLHVAGYALLDLFIFFFVMAAHFNHEKREVLGLFLVAEVLQFMWMSSVQNRFEAYI